MKGRHTHLAMLFLLVLPMAPSCSRADELGTPVRDREATSYKMRSAASKALGHFEDAGAMDPSIPTVREGGRWMREVVGEAVVAIGATSLKFLIAALKMRLRRRRSCLRRWR